ncbi:MAG: hypothetical protein Q9174_003896, partial [Haloplaca sp. 1 TL-2023]
LRSNSQTEGRFGEGGGQVGEVYKTLYGKEALYDALDAWEEIAKDAGVTKAALAYRWVVYHSALGEGDGVIVGARHVGQLEETLEAIDAGPLEKGVAERVNKWWESVKGAAPREAWQEYVGSKA